MRGDAPISADLSAAPAASARQTAASWRYAAPFATLIAMLAVSPYLPGGQALGYGMRTVAVAAVFLACSRKLIERGPAHALGSILLGAAVFAVWVGPDALWPGYRNHWLFSNAVVGVPLNGRKPAEAGAAWIAFRAAGSALVVPFAEELFWRGWLLRRLVSVDFARAPLAYAPSAFWITAVLFASEHGPYWDVGLAAGVMYNWWMIRTRNLADCILAHAVTNGCLAAYVVLAGAWQYWL